MRRNALGKLYDRLSPEERFRLDVEAMARGDMEESELLTRTCPRRSYVMNDVGFAGRWQAAKELALLTCMDLACKVEKLQLIEAFGIILSAFANMASLEAGVEGEDAHTRTLKLAREMPQRTEDLKRSIAVDGLSVWAAFKGFCAMEMGLEAQKLLEALAQPLVERAGELEKIAERLEVEPDSEVVEDCAATLRENWQRQLLARG